jgi:hypothetical protein
MASDVPRQPGSSRRRFLLGSAAIGAGVAAVPFAFPGSAGAATQPDGHRAAPRIFANNVGYDPQGPKRAVIGDTEPGRAPRRFVLVDVTTGRAAHQGLAGYAGSVDDWRTNNFPAIPGYFWIADFTGFATPGQYVIMLDSDDPGRLPVTSAPFRIEQDVLERRTLSHIVHYFKDSRSSGQFDKADRSLPMKGTTARFDAHGGWYDAAADWGKHFTQLSNLSYFNTLSIPLTAWVLFASHDQLARRAEGNLTALLAWTLDEAMYGADYLTRVHPKGGSFYSSVSQPEADDLGIDPTQRSLSSRTVDYREGGGLAIAALARASTYPVSGEYTSAQYLAAAQDAFAFLQANNVNLTNDKKENIQDDYNALLAATELAKATHDPAYQRAADTRAANLCGRLVSWHGYRDYWRADAVDRPFFHPSDAGLPIVALLAYLDIANAATRATVLDVVRRSLEFELAVTAEVSNPFGYARQLVQDGGGQRYSGFFFPQNVTPRSQDNWWQGENARLASLASAARLAAGHFTDQRFAARLHGYAADQLNWIVGVNPYDVCMLEGAGREAPLYLEYADNDPNGSWRWLRSAGGIVNGITGKSVDGRGIQWDPGQADTGPNTDWRWLEQWLPHSTWFMYAVTIGGAGR